MEAKVGPLTEFVENIIFNLFDVLEIFLIDNGTQLISKTFKEHLQSYHVNHWLTPAYHPQVNNTEQVNRVITTAIRSTLKKAHKHWADNVQTIVNAIRTTVHDSTKYTQYFVVFGRNEISDGREFARIRDHHAPQKMTESKVTRKRELLYEEVRKNLHTNALRNTTTCAPTIAVRDSWRGFFGWSAKNCYRNLNPV